MKILRLKEVLHITGLSKATVYEFIAKDKFPKSISLGARSVGWIDLEIEQWIKDKMKARDCVL